MSEDATPVPAADLPVQPWLAAAAPAGFWRRVAARVIDILLLLPITLTLVLSTGSSRDLSIAADVLGLLVTQAYVVLSLYLWCQTAGKMIMGVRVISLDGDRLTLTQSVLRSSVEIGFAGLIVAFTALAKLGITRAAFAALPLADRAQMVSDAAPQLWTINLLNGLWFFAGGIALLFTRNHRAPHDFIAGTRVVRVESATEEEDAGITA